MRLCTCERQSCTVRGVDADRPIGMAAALLACSTAAASHGGLAFFASSICSYEEIHGLRELFKSFDRNGDGQITLDELREGLARQARTGPAAAQRVEGVGEGRRVEAATHAQQPTNEASQNQSLQGARPAAELGWARKPLSTLSPAQGLEAP